MNTLTWLDLTAADRDRMRQVLDLFNEQGTVDELGLGTLRDVFANALFPGTSTIQTRLRYMLFVPWLYQGLESKRTAAGGVREQARAAELGLIHPLLASEDTDGVIGSRSSTQLRRLPSDVYWGGLVRWGLFVPAKSKGWYHRNFEQFSRRKTASRADDPGLVWVQERSWHPRLPRAPEGFPREAELALAAHEARFLQGAIETRCGGSLLALFAGDDAGAPADGPFWLQPALAGASPMLRADVELARRFSRHVEGASLIYNLMLAERRARLRPDGDDGERAEAYRRELAAWADAEDDEPTFDVGALWTYVAAQGGKPREGLLRFVERWTERVTTLGAAKLADDDTVRTLIQRREMMLKTARSRFTNQSRLLSWSGRVGVGRMDYRWHRVRALLEDLHRGLEAD